MKVEFSNLNPPWNVNVTVKDSTHQYRIELNARFAILQNNSIKIYCDTAEQLKTYFEKEWGEKITEITYKNMPAL